jgi:hypothetical protein
MSATSLLKTVLYKAGYSIKKVRPRATQSGPSSPRQLAGGELMGMIHKVSPYDGFAWREIPLDDHGWGGQSPAFRKLITEIKPELIIEVGSWKGASAIEMATVCRDVAPTAKVVCVDTWLGALEFWTDQSDPQRFGSLALKHGYPTVYYQFLANICHKGLQDTVIPFPQTAAIGALWCRFYGIQADLIYLDGSHEEEDVFQDLCAYWELVRAGGVLFGDDYGWDGVRLAVDSFAKQEGLKVAFLDDKWLLRRVR